MINLLNNKHILLGITGGIAAYKSAELTRRLKEAGADVRVVMTSHAKEFITALTLQALSGNPVHDDLFDVKAEAAMGHIELARWADVVLVAPATADFIARFIKGEANDLLTTLCLATKAPIAIAPAMNQIMWQNTVTKDNVQQLKTRGISIFGPGEGSQACGEVGPGRMLEPLELMEQLSTLFATGVLSHQKVLITAGPTEEPIDPVRYISNHSSGKMGYALAEAAYEAGAEVTLVSGPVKLLPPPRIHCIQVKTAEEMYHAVMKEIASFDIFLSVAAVADYRAKTVMPQKIAKKDATLTLQLERTPDIIASVAALKSKPFIVGFAAETDHLLEKATTKLTQKSIDMIIANLVGPTLGFAKDDNEVTVLWGHHQKMFPLMSKTQLARELINFIATILKEKRG